MKMTFTEYQAIDRMNASTLVRGIKSMRALHRAIHDRPDEPTAAMSFGNKYHSMILEPEDFEASFAVMPNYAAMEGNVTGKGVRSNSWSTDFCKQSKTAFEAECEAAGKSVITREEYDRGLAMCESIAGNQMASSLILAAEKEVTLLCEIEGLPFKCRIDLMGENYIADLKGTNNADAVAFGRTCANLHYGFKMAIYREAFKYHHGFNPEVYLIAVETAGDFDCVVYRVPDAVLESGLEHARKVINQYKDCQTSGIWPGVDKGEEVVDLYVPNWAMPEEQELDWSGIDG